MRNKIMPILIAGLLFVLGAMIFIVETTAYVNGIKGQVTSNLLTAAICGLLFIALAGVLIRWFFDIEKSVDNSLKGVYEAEIERDIQASKNMLAKQQAEIENLRAQLIEHIQNASTALEKRQTAQAESSLEMGLQMLDEALPTYSGNYVLDAVVHAKSTEMESEGLQLEIDLCSSPTTPLSNIELSALIFNLLDNAAAGAKAVNGTKISISSRIAAGQLLLEVSNPCSAKLKGEIQPQLGLINGKTAGDQKAHGWGMGNVMTIAEAHDGAATFEARKGTFTASVMIPL